MPVALERKLKKEAEKKGLTGERKDAYTYGTLRKTGWKPSREKKMNDPSESIKFAVGEEVESALERLTKMRKAGGPFMRTPGKGGVPRGYSSMEAYTRTPPDWDKSFKNKPFVGKSSLRYDPSQSHASWLSASSKLIRLAQIDNQLDSIIHFQSQDDDDENKKNLLGTAAKVGAAGAVGAGGLLAHQAISGTGGYAKNWMAGKAAFGRGLAGTGLQGVAKGPGRVVGQQIGGALAKLKDVLPSLRLSSKRPEIRFDEHLLEPWQGPLAKTKIAQEQFPAGPNPDFAPWAKNLSREEMLKLPFPELMKYLNKRNLLQQRFSSKLGRLVELNAKLDEIQLR